MQSSRLSFPFTDHPPPFDDEFPTLRQVHHYLRSYAEQFGVLPLIRFDTPVTRIVKVDGRWAVTADAVTETYDAVMVASGELWPPRMPDFVPGPQTGVHVLSAKDYRNPAAPLARSVPAAPPPEHPSACAGIGNAPETTASSRQGRLLRRRARRQ
ncbi:hypothetical protein [Actinoplanes cyaneus]|nr:Flavin-binding monooxygenase-like [Actinoplanes cyaneus]